MVLFSLSSSLAASAFLIFLPAKAERMRVFSLKETVSKKDLPPSELREILQDLQSKDMEKSQADTIEEKSKIYYIPTEITEKLRRHSLLNPKGVTYQKMLQAEGHMQILWNKRIVSLFMNSNESPYRESNRSQAIRALGAIGRSQILPPNTVHYLRSLMFEMRNPNIRPYVVAAFIDIATLHPPTSEVMSRLALRIRRLRENIRIVNQRQKYSELREQERRQGKSLYQFIENHGFPPFYIGSLNEDEKIYTLLEKMAETHPIPTGVTHEMILTVDSEYRGLNGEDVFLNSLLRALLAVAKRQGFLPESISHLKRIKSEKRHSQIEIQIDEILESAQIPLCQREFHHPQSLSSLHH